MFLKDWMDRIIEVIEPVAESTGVPGPFIFMGGMFLIAALLLAVVFMIPKKDKPEQVFAKEQEKEPVEHVPEDAEDAEETELVELIE